MAPTLMDDTLHKTIELLENSDYTVVFSGAGISVESGIPPFRGPDGLWQTYDPVFLQLDHFIANPKSSWEMIHKIFYEFIGAAQPNPGHRAVADLEMLGRVSAVITQNIDALHQKAGSRTVHEYHGTIRQLECLQCFRKFPCQKIDPDSLPPQCPRCGGILRPDVVFFGEPINPDVMHATLRAAERAAVMIVVGTSGAIMPAAAIPRFAKDEGAAIVEVNTAPSIYTPEITDLFLQGRASTVLPQLVRALPKRG